LTVRSTVDTFAEKFFLLLFQFLDFAREFQFRLLNANAFAAKLLWVDCAKCFFFGWEAQPTA
jgi:hypothetical protein